LGDILLRKPTVTVVQAADGRLNIASLGSGSEPRTAGRSSRGGGGGPGASGAALATRVVIDDGQVIYAARGSGEQPAQYRLEGLDLTITSGGPQIAFKG